MTWCAMRSLGKAAQWKPSVVGVRGCRAFSGVSDETISKAVAQHLPNAEFVPSDQDDWSPSIIKAIGTIEERQEFHRIPSVVAIEKSRCRHGFPRAYVQRPVYRTVDGGTIDGVEIKLDRDGKKLKNRDDFTTQSSSIRLSCPHLIQAIDRFEYEGKGIERINMGLNERAIEEEISEGAVERVTHTQTPCNVDEEKLTVSARAMRQHFRDVCKNWQGFKAVMVSDSDRVVLQHKLGEKGASHFMSSGPGGISHDVVGDVKCLHVQVADSLMRGEDENKFGRWTLRKLKEEYDIDADGCSNCWQQCDRNFKRTLDSYWYVPAKNRHGLRISKINKHFAQLMHRRRVASEGQRQEDGTVARPVRGVFRDGVYVKAAAAGGVLPRKNSYDRELSDEEFVRYMEERNRQMTMVGMESSRQSGDSEVDSDVDSEVDSDVDTDGTVGDDEEVAADSAEESDAEDDSEMLVRYDIGGDTVKVKVKAADRAKGSRQEGSPGYTLLSERLRQR